MRDAGTLSTTRRWSRFAWLVREGSSSRQLYKEMADNKQKEGAQPKEDAGERYPATVTISNCSPAVPAAPLSRQPNPKLNRQRKLDPLSRNATCSAWSRAGNRRDKPEAVVQQKRVSSPSRNSEKRPRYGRRRLAAELRP